MNFRQTNLWLSVIYCMTVVSTFLFSYHQMLVILVVNQKLKTQHALIKCSRFLIFNMFLCTSVPVSVVLQLQLSVFDNWLIKKSKLPPCNKLRKNQGSSDGKSSILYDSRNPIILPQIVARDKDCTRKQTRVYQWTQSKLSRFIRRPSTLLHKEPIIGYVYKGKSTGSDYGDDDSRV